MDDLHGRPFSVSSRCPPNGWGSEVVAVVWAGMWGVEASAVMQVDAVLASLFPATLLVAVFQQNDGSLHKSAGNFLSVFPLSA